MEVDNNIYGASFNNLEKSIKEASYRHSLIAKNIANIESDNYSKLSFQTELEKAQARKLDKQTLLDNELTRLAENNLRMTSYAQILSSKIKTLKKVVTLGKG